MPALRCLLPFPLLSLVVGLLWGCLPSPPPQPAGQPGGGGDLTVALPCRPLVTGELVIPEVLAQPSGLDLDGDGAGNARDEAVELRVDSAEPVHLHGTSLWLDGVLRGHIVAPRCVLPGTLVVLTSSKTADLALDPTGVTQVRLDKPLGLRDTGGRIELRGVLGTVLAEAAYGGPLKPGQSWARSIDSDRTSPLEPHPPLEGGGLHSLGRCRDGRTADACWPAHDSYGDGRTVSGPRRIRRPVARICGLALDRGISSP